MLHQKLREARNASRKVVSPFSSFSCSVCLSAGRSVRVQEMCESRGGRPGLSALTSLMVSVDVKLYCTMLTDWSQLVPSMSTDVPGH